MSARLGDYDLITQVAEGSTGEVWRARRRSGIGQVVAIKRLRGEVPADQRRRLLAEAAVLNELDHPHIVIVLDVLDDHRDGGGVALVMPFAPGGTLVDLLAERGALGPGPTVAVTAPLAAALASAHRRQVLHGDVKPANVLFTSDGEPLLADFGANRVGEGVELTPEYAAPEVLAGRGSSPASDVYSLATVAVEALTGAPPAGGLLASTGDDAGAVAAVLADALDPDPASRPSADEFGQRLRVAVDNEAIKLPGPATARAGGGAGTRAFGPQPDRSGGPTRRRTMTRAAVIGVIAAVATGAVVALGGGGDDAPSCPEVEVTPTPEAQIVEGDFNGDGCATPAAFTPNAAGGTGVLRVSIDGTDPFEARVGGTGDVLVVGDWDCDGVDRPALFRPADGTIVYLDTLEAGAAATAVTVEGTGSEVSVATDDDGCDRVVRGG